MTDVIRKQILIELINLLENPRKKIQLNEFDIPFSSEELESSKAALDTAFSNAAEELRYLFNIAYRKQTAVGRFHTQAQQLIPKMWDAASKLTWDDIKLLKDKDPVILFTLGLDMGSLFDKTGVLDITAGSINLAHALAQSEKDALNITFALIQLGFGLLQAYSYLHTGGKSAALFDLFKIIVRGGKQLLQDPKIWSKAIEGIKSFLDDIIKYFYSTPISRRVKDLYNYLYNFFNKIDNINPQNLPNSPLFIDDVARLEAARKALVITPKPSKIRELLSLVGWSGFQLASLRVGAGGAKLYAFNRKTQEMKEKAEKYMREVACKDKEEDALFGKCQYIKTIYPSLEVKYSNVPLETNVSQIPDASSVQTQSPMVYGDLLYYYYTIREQKFKEMIKQDTEYHELLLDIMDVPASQKMSSP